MSEPKEFKIGDFKTDESLFIEASAGTGKTYTIQLMVAKMIAEGTPLKKILIVTYTEKAAGELKDRIRKKINEVLEKHKIDKDEPELNELQLAAFRKAYQDVDNAAIFTIHSFCQKALKEYAYDAGRPFDMTMVDDTAVEDFVEQLIRDRWAKDEEFKNLFVGSEKTSSFISDLKKQLVKVVDAYKGKNSVGENIVELDEPAIEWKGDSISKENAELLLKKIELKERLFEYLLKFKKLKEKIDILRANEKKEFIAERSATKNGEKIVVDVRMPVSDLVGLIETFDNTNNPFTPAKIGESLKDVKDDEFGRALNYVYDRVKVLSKIGEHIQKELDAYPLRLFLYNQTSNVFNEWQQYKSENKLQSFNDMILSVHQAVLSSENSLKSRLRAQYKYAIIDEFQDTNQLQWDIFRQVFLKENEEPVADHSIFVVGDPKQSIYSFQGADVNVYQMATQEIGNRNDLLCNYRSTDKVIHGCTALFEGDFFKPAEGMSKLIVFSGSDVPSDDKKKVQPTIDGEPKNSIWLSEENISPENFAKDAVAKIIDWCSYDKNGKTRLQVFDKDDPSKLRDVSFKDFAILAKSRSEMEIIEGTMRNVGLPYMRYKEANLFKSRECAEWIALFRAINAPDFSSWNRKLLSEVLITDFFKDMVASHKPKSPNKDESVQKDKSDKKDESVNVLDILYSVESEYFDNPNIKERMCIATWRSLAIRHRYAELLEQIFRDTQIENRLMKVESLQGMTRLRQIGNYAIDYLYRNRCSLDDLIRHLEGLAHYKESVDDENGDLVEKGSDFNAVQVMTIHASKGLEFPVVVSVAGFKGYNKNSSAPFLYHDEEKKLHIGFGDIARTSRKNEELEEWKRLFYVDFTRTSSILVLPRYKKWTEVYKNGNLKYPEFSFLSNAIGSFAKNKKDDAGFLESSSRSDFDSKPFVKAILKKVDVETFNALAKSEEQNKIDLDKEIEKQKSEMTALQSALPERAIMQFSYSNLSKNAKGEDDASEFADENDSPVSKDGVADDAEEQKTLVEKKGAISLKDFDTDVVTKNCDTVDSREEILGEDKYPRGSKIGDALHNVLEQVRFKEFGEKYKTLQQALENPSAELKNTIDEEFKAASLPIEKNREEWNAITTRYIWNTLNADLPVIAGGEFVKDAKPFKLTDLPLTDHKPEVRFDLNADIKSVAESSGPENEVGEAFALLHRVCKGFIDLLFVREVDGVKRYSILDWKSDTLENYSYKNIKDKVDHEYSVQRVLYSYCLIQWLKQFYGKRKTKSGTFEGLDEQQIFEKHFGGIYYAFLRGTVGGEKSPTSESYVCHGIYAQTWEKYETLEDAYKLVKKKLMGGNRD